MNQCIFCQIIRGDIASRKIYETDKSLAILDAFPLKQGHTLIISKSHKSKVQDLDRMESTDMFSILHFITPHIEKAVDSNSSLIAIHNGEGAGQEIPHVHIHIIPINKEEKRKTSVHSLFLKDKIEENRIDEIRNKIIDEINSTQRF